MSISIIEDRRRQLIPVLSEKEKQEMAAYYTVYEKYADELSRKVTADLAGYPVFGKVTGGSLKEVAAADSKLLAAMQKDAIINSNWGHYIEYQIAQGIAYAKTGLDFKSWHQVIVRFRNYMIPLLQKEYGDGEALLFSLNGMNRFIDIGIGITGEAYLGEKQGIIEEERNKTKILNEALEEKVIEGIGKHKEMEAKLKSVSKELESFSYSVSHDLRSPLRAINGFSEILYEDYGSKLDAEGVNTLKIIRDNSKKMGQLIDALLEFSKQGRRGFSDSEINMMQLVSSLREDVMSRESSITEFIIDALPAATGDREMIKRVWFDLVSNAIKFSKQKPETRIEIGSFYKDNLIVYYVKDKGAGFDMLYYDKLFGVFQRLHSQEEFAGMGIGLSMVEKVITRHGGTVWAESKVNEGSCFYFSLPNVNLEN